ncbi:uncharacterized protein LOC129253826 isoform X3 [Lytechinus pictus]|uniref:uncharacterized protein LOC129253826 isoform X3 n=2 Tax=Lytechinus pictus TaxID=7653 RepID=UPI0030B9D613
MAEDPARTPVDQTKNLEETLLRTKRLLVYNHRFYQRYDWHGQGVMKSGQKTRLRGDAGLEVQVQEWMSVDEETRIALMDDLEMPFENIITILAQLCPEVKHISIDSDDLIVHQDRSNVKPMKSALTICLEYHDGDSLEDALLAIGDCFPNAERLDLRCEDVDFPPTDEQDNDITPLSSLRECRIRVWKTYHLDRFLFFLSSFCPDIVSLVLSTPRRLISRKSTKDISSCKFPHLTNIRLEPFADYDFYILESLTNVLHVGDVMSPLFNSVEAKKVQLGGVELTAVRWYRTSSSCELQLEGASGVVPMADMMHLLFNEFKGITVLTFDRCDLDLSSSEARPLRAGGTSLREIKFVHMEHWLSQSDTDTLSETFPNVKITTKHASQDLLAGSKQGTRVSSELRERTFAPSTSAQACSEGKDDLPRGSTKAIKLECIKRVGSEGGKLQLESFGIELEIPPGAIDSKETRELLLRVLPDTPNLGDSEEEVSVCFGVQCLAPGDLVLRLPVTYTIPHCAMAAQTSSLEAVLYTGEGEYTFNAVIKERIMLPRSGVPSCNIIKDVLTLKMDHFSWAKIMIKMNNLSFRGKQMRCRPFREKKLTWKVILHTHLYRKVKGNKELLEMEEEKQGFVPAHVEQPVYIMVAGVGLKMQCNAECKKMAECVVSYKRLRCGGRICVPFELYFPSHPDSVALSLKVGQSEELEETFIFPLDFTAPQDKGGGGGELDMRIVEITEVNLRDLSNKLGSEWRTVGTFLGFDNSEIQIILEQHTNIKECIFQMLLRWRKVKGAEATKERLKKVLRRSGREDLTFILEDSDDMEL